ncbi:energy-coupling factor ABC transporter ATP-binding protein [Aurantimonas sp. MSK8Z-1]|uniref:energy-coupling factor ABC transporter ATP-binding protein n=1 Tax=Mangrovibrevibacter kandeliae TaxID=2968473 RepID=UPI0021178BDC|nr:ABC transporter ATP-binding protein [Aurantimonas sp. MSK8Z-1]MCW4113951.1 energy-coupling factor ABC transporter ATP-binding protein [Aurantimonas sp. MSK8Z-1]
MEAVALERGGQPVLARLDLCLTERRIGVIGANGSGKSSFARLLNGLLAPTGGRVTVDGLDTVKDAKAVRRRVGFVFQNPDSQIVYPTVGEDLAFGLKPLKLEKPEEARRIREILERYGLAGAEDRLVHELSGGERQLVALASVLIMRPSILVLDEPTTLLDLRNTRRLMAAIDALSERVVMVTHDLALLAGFDRVLLFDEGRLVADGAPATVIERYRALLA